jgi:hypothetical protein
MGKKKIEQLDPRIKNINGKISDSLKKADGLRFQLSNLTNNSSRIRLVTVRLKEIEDQYRKRGALHLLGIDSTYREFKAEQKNYSPDGIAAYKKKLEEELEGLERQRQQYVQELQATRLRLAEEAARQAKLEQEKRLQQAKAKEAEKAKRVEAHKNKLAKAASNTKTSKIVPPKSNIVSAFFPKNTAGLLVTASHEISVPWEDVSFKDGYLVLKYRDSYYQTYNAKCKKFLNEIRSHYSFRGVPELQAVVAGREIIRIINEEVLFFHIEFLTDSGTLFNTAYSKASVKKWSHYTKAYYRQHLKFAVQSRCLERLCELSHADFPIVPVGELVKTRSGSVQVHHSFIFPVVAKSGIKIIWESTEESKASYVFEGDLGYYKSAQRIYDYIVGDTTNKRETLIHSSSLQQQLEYERRIRHTYFSEWNAELGFVTRC